LRVEGKEKATDGKRRKQKYETERQKYDIEKLVYKINQMKYCHKNALTRVSVEKNKTRVGSSPNSSRYSRIGVYNIQRIALGCEQGDEKMNEPKNPPLADSERSFLSLCWYE
jgi:hypothetical protein